MNDKTSERTDTVVGIHKPNFKENNMNQKAAKRLRRKARAIALATYEKTESTKMQTGSTQHWDKGSPVWVYKMLKKAHRRKLYPELTKR